LNNAGGSDTLSIFDGANASQLPLGSLALGANYATANRTFTGSTMVMSGSTITITLGTPSGNVSTVNPARTMTWTPAVGSTDLAGNPCSVATVTESGPADNEF
jgi:hypothetical protein